MALHFGLHDQARYDKLPKAAKEFMHNVLPWWCMTAGVGYINEESARIVIERVAMLHYSDVINVAKSIAPDKEGVNPTVVVDFIREHFLGFRANIITESTPEFLKRIGDARLSKFTKAQANKLDQLKRKEAV